MEGRVHGVTRECQRLASTANPEMGNGLQMLAQKYDLERWLGVVAATSGSLEAGAGEEPLEANKKARGAKPLA